MQQAAAGRQCTACIKQDAIMLFLPVPVKSPREVKTRQRRVAKERRAKLRKSTWREERTDPGYPICYLLAKVDLADWMGSGQLGLNFINSSMAKIFGKEYMLLKKLVRNICCSKKLVRNIFSRIPFF